MIKLSWVLGVLAAAAPVFATECETGKTSFQTSVHQKIMRDCKACHGGLSTAPAFAVEDVTQSYYRVLNYMNFSDLSKATFVIRAGNGHCGLPNCNDVSGAEMRQLAQQWWEQGQKDCPSHSRYYTTEEPMPATLSETDFVVMKWDLGTVSDALKGSTITVEVKQYTKATPLTPGAYLFQRPRLWGAAKDLRVSDLKIYVNRGYDGLATNFTTIDAVLSPSTKKTPSPYPMLSADTQIVIQSSDKDLISLGFGEISPAAAEPCRAVAEFESSVLPRLETARCFRCHGGDGQTGSEPAKDFYSMEGTTEELCRATRQRLTRDLPTLQLSQLVLLPLHGKFGHPKAIGEFETLDYLADLKRWAALEKGVNHVSR